MGRSSRNADVALKLDMLKAYDRVSWIFLTSVLRRFGFGEQWIDRIWRLLSNVWFSVLVNGSSVGFFKSTRELRQGDPLSPWLFIVGAEVLSRSLNKLIEYQEFKCFSVPRGCSRITHLSYADGVLVFSSASSSSLRCVMQTIRSYEAISGFLSNGGRLILIKHVLSAVSIHLLAASCPPKGVLALAERAMANFLWGEREGGLRHHWIKWLDLCADSSQEGLVFGRYWRSSQRSRSNYGGASGQVTAYGRHSCGPSTAGLVIHAW
ncbi:uncharacterized protein LOC113774033 [Coffea eugenioides]|uniref:uncharacterized protein LOC113774033 n=1 Tax=Coffea eugenioides TaxID=49369 RepID=UPI000F606C3F|nr:uncharacterized protein LOC113774033 [Coffea eugenioides]